MTVQALVETFPWVDIDAQWFPQLLPDAGQVKAQQSYPKDH